MRKIKKYANRKLYDTTDKQYISMTRLAEVIKRGEEITVVDNTNGEDITASIVSQLLAKEKRSTTPDASSRILVQLLRKGGGTIIDYAKKYTSLWQNALNMADGEIDKIVGHLVNDKEISESEGKRLKDEILGYTENLKKWVNDKVDKRIKEKIDFEGVGIKKELQGQLLFAKNKVGDVVDQRIKDVLRMMNLPSSEQVKELNKKIEQLTRKVEGLEKNQK